MKDRELKGREVKIKRKMEELLFKLITVSFDDMEKFKRKEMKKKRPIKNTWHDWLVNYISEAIRKTGGEFKDKLVSFLKQMRLKIMVNKLCIGKKRNQGNKNLRKK